MEIRGVLETGPVEARSDQGQSPAGRGLHSPRRDDGRPGLKGAVLEGKQLIHPGPISRVESSGCSMAVGGREKERHFPEVHRALSRLNVL